MPNQSIAMLFLCAGASRRMGRSKALLPWQASTILGHHWNLFQSLEKYDPWIVTQKNDEPLVAELERVGWPDAHRVMNPLAPEGDMMDSIRYGVSACLKHDYTAIGIALIDQPLIDHSTFQILADSVRRYPDSILQPAMQGRRGHPVLLPRSIAEQLVSSNAETLKTFLSENERIRASIEVDDSGILTDLDTPHAYQTHAPQLT
ncbi:MAG: nucleotidyltransferase family protein [Pontiella sp.]